MPVEVTDRIEKKVLLRAPRARVWEAITDSQQFGQWFGVKFGGPFKAGQRISGAITPTTADPAVAKMQEPYAGMRFDITIDRIEPERLFSFRWHPFAIDPKLDYSDEPTTLVEFTLEDAKGGTLLTVVESGFDRVPLARRTQAFTANEQGWAMQVTLIEKYLAHAS
jgi:uncharacterized protein YndB with AHSA1/START domain